jgi:hypothetical protein
VASMIERVTGLRSRGVQGLCTSFSFMNRKNLREKAPRKLLLFGGGNETLLRLLNLAVRILDRVLKSRLSLYGWAFYFGELSTEVPFRTWTNVCVRCGSGHPSEWLVDSNKVFRKWRLFRFWSCPICSAENHFTRDRDFLFLGDY